jgi:hypothetical protein
MAEIFEGIMIVSFGVSWPISVLRSWKSRSNKGKSLLFLLVIEFGYIMGLFGKIFINPSILIAVYSFNTFFVTLDIFLYFRNKRLEQMNKPGIPASDACAKT